MSTPLETVEYETGTHPEHSIIWLHGLGADGNDFNPIVPELVTPNWPALRFVFPHAPVRPVTLNGGMPMRAWYDVTELNLNTRQDETGIRTSIRNIETLIARERARGVPDAHIVLVGFSQGGAIALAAGLRYKNKLAGIVALSSYLVLGDSLADERSNANTSTPIFLGHGKLDAILPLSLGQATRDRLLATGYAVDWHEYPIAHTLSAPEVSDLQCWLSQRLHTTFAYDPSMRHP